ncbi:unnamed protein product [Caenorhabditis sp. 36 PRJEB53466]|nr:unnamed protein product [Caenorhabditis sp. 36 PRJEB53466]
MFYYIDSSNNYRGPYSEQAYEKWFNNEQMPAGTPIFDENLQRYAIEDIVCKSLKSRTKVIFQDETTIEDRTIDQTNLDVTLNINQTYRPNDSTFFHPDFTQIEEEVDEVDCGRGSEKDVAQAYLQKVCGMYVDRRSLVNRRRRFPDNYVPFEFPWSRWVPQPLTYSQAMRGTVHLHNVLQDFHPDLFSTYLSSLNISPHPCARCHVSFANLFEMLCHFVSVPHVNRVYHEQSDSTNVLSMADVHCVQKMISVVEELEEEEGDVRLDTGPSKREASFFDDVDVATAFDSLKSTVLLMQTVPLLEPPKEESDVCEYMEAVILFRSFECDYLRTEQEFRRRRFGLTGKTSCAYCHVEFDATFLESFLNHLLSEHHIANALRVGVSRTEMEYWLSFLGVILKGKQNNRSDMRYRQKAETSLQEGDFPLCYRLVDLAQGDFIYQGAEVEPVLSYIRRLVRTSYPLLDDYKFRTSCRWCHVELCSQYALLRHILYDKSHTDRLHAVSNDDLRRLLKLLRIPVTMPLFSVTQTQSRQFMAPLLGEHKKRMMQRLKNAAWRKHKKRAIQTMASRSFPMGLVNRCELCAEDVEHVEAIITHFCSENHGINVTTNPRITDSDFACWLTIFNVGGRALR